MRPALRFFAVLALAGCSRTAPVEEGELTVFNAGSLAYPVKELLSAYALTHPGLVARQESSGSLEAARKLTELGKIPDVLAVADYNVIAKLLIPRFTGWYASFASNAMVLSYTDRSVAAGEINARNWWRILLRPEVRWGQSDPALDPNGYRTLMVFQLAEQFEREPGLAGRLRASLRPGLMRPAEAQLVGLLQAGELDYAWSYRSLAATGKLRWVDLPPEIDLSDPAHAGEYAEASVRLPGAQAGDSVTFRGEPIVYALTIPAAAAHRAAAESFVRFVFSPEGREILQRAGFRLLDRPAIVGSGAPEGVLP